MGTEREDGDRSGGFVRSAPQAGMSRAWARRRDSFRAKPIEFGVRYSSGLPLPRLNLGQGPGGID